MGKLGQLLVTRNWITVQQLTRALKNQNVGGGRLGTCLLEMDAITEELLQKGLSEQLGVPSAGIDDLRGIPDEVIQLLPDKLARRCRAVPFRVEGGRLDVAMMDPRNLSAQDEIAFASGKRVKVHVAHEVRVMEGLERYYGEECPSRIGLVIERLNRARYFWEKPGDKAPEPAEPLLPPIDSPFSTPPRMSPPPLPEPALPPTPRRVPAPPAAPVLAPPPAAPATPAIPAIIASARPAPAPAPRPLAAPVAAAPEPAPAAVMAPAPPPPRPLSVSLTPEEKAALGAVRRAADPVTLEEAEAALAEAEDLDEMGQILINFLSRTHRRVALFQIVRDRINGWMASGATVDKAAFEAFSVGFDQPSLFLNLRQGNNLYLGPLPPMPSHRELARTWGGEMPRDCIVLPVRLKDRLVTVVYADGAAKGLASVDLQTMHRLTAATAAAFERCILQKKRRGTKV
jgi:hypothetical protein